MTAFIERTMRVFLGVGLILALTSCGGGGGVDDATTDAGARGTVGILLTDKPADPALFDSINASIRKVELLGSNENNRVTLYAGEVKTFDLLRLRNEAIPLVYRDDVPSGKYCKIRLTLADLELVLADATPSDPTDNETYHPKLPGNGKLDLVVKGCFSVTGDEVLTLQLDIDAGKSIHVVENKKGYNFRPVIFVDVVDQAFASKLVRVTGEIAKIDAVQKSLLLCGAIPGNYRNSMGCVELHFGPDSAFFDNMDYSGAPRSIDELLSANRLGMEVTAVGWPRSGADPYRDDDEHYPLMFLDVLAVELGKFLQVEGEVAVDSDATGFAMALSSGGPIISNDRLAVMYQPGGGGINGTRIVSKTGAILNPSQVVVPLPVQVDGTLQLIQGSDPILMAALVILDKAEPGAEQVTGTILSVGTGTLTLEPDADNVCGAATSSLAVNLDDDLEVLTVTIMDTGSVITPGGTLAVGQTVGMSGNCESGGYLTDNIVIVDDQR